MMTPRTGITTINAHSVACLASDRSSYHPFQCDHCPDQHGSKHNDIPEHVLPGLNFGMFLLTHRHFLSTDCVNERHSSCTHHRCRRSAIVPCVRAR